MFLKYRIRKLQIKVDVKHELVKLLMQSEKQYNNSYYTDKYHEEHCKYVEMYLRLQYLQAKLPNMFPGKEALEQYKGIQDVNIR